jgi:phage tail sheath protein FI
MRRYRASSPTFLEVIEFEVFASLRDQREVFRGLQISPLSRRYAPRIINDESQLIRLEDLQSKAPLPKNLPQAEPAAKLSGGRDGTEILTAEDFIGFDRGPSDRAGLMSLASVEQVALLCVPDVMLAYRRVSAPQADQMVQQVQDAMIGMCESLQDRFAILDAPPTKDVEEVKKWRRRLDTSFAGLYYPWINLGSDAQSLVPPSGHVAGVVARCDAQVGVHKAPGNEIIKGAVGLMIGLSEDHLGVLNSDGINALRAFPGRGVRIWGACTTSDDPNWRYINVRRLFIMLRRTLEEGTQWAVFEPNEPKTWERLSRDVSQFLNDLWGLGYFAGDSPEESFFVRCDATTNDADTRNQGKMIMEIGIAPAIPTEYIVFSIVQKMGEQASEAGASA